MHAPNSHVRARARPSAMSHEERGCNEDKTICLRATPHVCKFFLSWA